MIRSLAAAILLLAPIPAAAQTTIDPSQGRLEILGTSRPACVIGAPSSSVGTNMVFSQVGPSVGRIEIPVFVDGDARPRGGSIEVMLPVICNAPHRVSIRSEGGALRREGPAVPAGPFAEAVPYEVAAFWAGRQSAGGSGAGPVTIDSNAARIGDVSVRVNVAAGGQPLVSGTYLDRIVVELQAAN